MRTPKTYSIPIFVALIAILLIWGCSDEIADPEQNIQLTIDLGRDADDVDHGWLVVDHDSENQLRLSRNENFLESGLLELEPGAHHFAATAVDVNENILFQGEATDTIPDGYGEFSLTIEMEAVRPICGFAPSTIDFGTVQIGQSKVDSFVISNSGNADMEVDISVDCTGFEIVAGTGAATIEPGQSLTIVVAFIPETIGEKTCSIQTGTDCQSIVVTGTAQEAPLTVPTAPTDLLATTVSSSQVDLTWTDNSDNETGYQIKRAINISGPFSEIDLVDPDTESYSDPTLSKATTYWYWVSAVNEAGSSNPTNLVSATTDDEVPTIPTGLAATVISVDAVELSWTDTSDNESGFRIERGTNVSGPFSVLGTVDPNVTEYIDSNLIQGMTYWYRVTAFNNVGEVGSTDPVPVTTGLESPAAPSDLIALTGSTSRIDLSWTDNSGNEAGFRIKRGHALNGTYTEIAMVGANTVNYSNTDLAISTKYYYKVTAYNDAGESNPTSPVSAMTGDETPVAPSGLIATVKSAAQIDLMWIDNSLTEDGFRVERSFAQHGQYEEVTPLGPNRTTYSNMGLDSSTKYYYRIIAYNTAGDSEPTEPVFAITEDVLPAAPSGLAATGVSNSQINLTWIDNSNDEKGFKIERSQALNGTYVEITPVGPNRSTYGDMGLTSSTKYYYRILSYNDAGESETTAPVYAMTLDVAPDAAPSDLIATAVSSSRIDLSWTDNSTNEKGFSIERSNALNGQFVEISPVGPNRTTYSNMGLASSTKYYYRVRAYNDAGETEYTTPLSAITLDELPTAAPSNLVATAVSGSQIDLSWADNSSNEKGFRILRSQALNGVYEEITPVGPNRTTYSNMGLTSSTKYYYKVSAYNTAGETNPTEAVWAMTLDVMPLVPSDLAATPITDTRIDLSWTDNSNNEKGFRIERSISGSGPWTLVTPVGPNRTTYSCMGLTASTEYYFRVLAYNDAGETDYTTPVSATTASPQPLDPSNLAATVESSSRINLTWTDNSRNETGYRIERSTIAVGGPYVVAGAVGVNASSFSDMGLAPATLYWYRVLAFNNEYESNRAGPISATTEDVPPAAPSGFEGTVINSSRIDLSWTDNSENETGFQIERAAAVGGPYTAIDTTAADVEAYSDTGLTAGTTYWYQMSALNSVGKSAPVDPISVTTAVGPPSKPTDLTATAITSQRIDLEWTDASDNETHFEVERSDAEDGTYIQIDTVGENGDVFSDRGLIPSTTYWYRVSSSNASGDSSPTDPVSATTLAHIPNAPTNLVATTFDHQRIDLTWTDNSDDETGFQIERSDGGAYAEVTTVVAGTTAYSDTGLAPATQYWYRVSAVNPSGSSAPSNIDDDTTDPAP